MSISVSTSPQARENPEHRGTVTLQIDADVFGHSSEGALLEFFGAIYRLQHPLETSSYALALPLKRSQKHIQKVMADQTSLSVSEWQDVTDFVGVNIFQPWYDAKTMLH